MKTIAIPEGYSCIVFVGDNILRTADEKEVVVPKQGETIVFIPTESNLEEELSSLRAMTTDRDFAMACYPEMDTMSATELREALVAELSDINMLARVGIVYEHVTKGLISKPNTHPQSVIAVANDCAEDWIKEAVQDRMEKIKPAINKLAWTAIRAGKHSTEDNMRTKMDEARANLLAAIRGEELVN